jgi:hypothetical protein
MLFRLVPRGSRHGSGQESGGRVRLMPSEPMCRHLMRELPPAVPFPIEPGDDISGPAVLAIQDRVNGAHEGLALVSHRQTNGV